MHSLRSLPMLFYQISQQTTEVAVDVDEHAFFRGILQLIGIPYISADGIHDTVKEQTLQHIPTFFFRCIGKRNNGERIIVEIERSA